MLDTVGGHKAEAILPRYTRMQRSSALSASSWMSIVTSEEEFVSLHATLPRGVCPICQEICRTSQPYQNESLGVLGRNVLASHLTYTGETWWAEWVDQSCYILGWFKVSVVALGPGVARCPNTEPYGQLMIVTIY